MREEWSLREFRALHAVITQGSITAAAHWLGVSQPAVSRSIAALEARVGHVLFERDGRSVRPTARAVRLNDRLMPFFAALDEISAEPRRSLGADKLKIGAPPAFCNGYLQAMIGAFRAVHGDVAVELDVVSSAMTVAQVAEGGLDLGISDMGIESGAVARRLLCTSDMACFMPADHPLADRGVISAVDLADQPIIGLSRRHLARRELERVLEGAGVADAIRIETSSTVSAMAFVERGLGLALMNPFPAGLHASPGIAMVALSPSITYATSLILPIATPLKPAASVFAAHLARSLPKRAWIKRGAASDQGGGKAPGGV